MTTPATDKREITRLIMDRTNSLLEAVLEDRTQALALFDRFMELDPDNYPLYEVYFGGFHMDLFYFAGLMLRNNEKSQPGKENEPEE